MNTAPTKASSTGKDRHDDHKANATAANNVQVIEGSNSKSKTKAISTHSRSKKHTSQDRTSASASNQKRSARKKSSSVDTSTYFPPHQEPLDAPAVTPPTFSDASYDNTAHSSAPQTRTNPKDYDCGTTTHSPPPQNPTYPNNHNHHRSSSNPYSNTTHTSPNPSPSTSTSSSYTPTIPSYLNAHDAYDAFIPAFSPALSYPLFSTSSSPFSTLQSQPHSTPLYSHTTTSLSHDIQHIGHWASDDDASLREVERNIASMAALRTGVLGSGRRRFECRRLMVRADVRDVLVRAECVFPRLVVEG